MRGNRGIKVKIGPQDNEDKEMRENPSAVKELRIETWQ